MAAQGGRAKVRPPRQSQKGPQGGEGPSFFNYYAKNKNEKEKKSKSALLALFPPARLGLCRVGISLPDTRRFGTLGPAWGYVRYGWRAVSLLLLWVFFAAASSPSVGALCSRPRGGEGLQEMRREAMGVPRLAAPENALVVFCVPLTLSILWGRGVWTCHSGEVGASHKQATEKGSRRFLFFLF